MPVVGRRHDDCVDIRACEDLAVVARGRDAGIGLFHFLEAGVADIRRGGDFNARDDHGVFHVALSHAARA